jgi:hypothetical protein
VVGKVDKKLLALLWNIASRKDLVKKLVDGASEMRDVALNPRELSVMSFERGRTLHD